VPGFGPGKIFGRLCVSIYNTTAHIPHGLIHYYILCGEQKTKVVGVTVWRHTTGLYFISPLLHNIQAEVVVFYCYGPGGCSSCRSMCPRIYTLYIHIYSCSYQVINKRVNKPDIVLYRATTPGAATTVGGESPSGAGGGCEGNAILEFCVRTDL